LVDTQHFDEYCQSCWPLGERSCFSLTFRARKVFAFLLKENKFAENRLM